MAKKNLFRIYDHMSRCEAFIYDFIFLYLSGYPNSDICTPEEEQNIFLFFDLSCLNTHCDTYSKNGKISKYIRIFN
jgi:hypothetical protein